MEIDEDLETAAQRELEEETGVRTGKLVQLATFGDPKRDPRGRTISVVYLAEVDPRKLQPRAADDAAAVQWFPLRRPPALAFDHREVLQCARTYLRRKR